MRPHLCFDDGVLIQMYKTSDEKSDCQDRCEKQDKTNHTPCNVSDENVTGGSTEKIQIKDCCLEDSQPCTTKFEQSERIVQRILQRRGK